MSEALGPCPKSHLIEELTAGVSDREDLQQVGGTEHALDVVLGDGDLPGVGVVDQTRDHGGLHSVESDHVLVEEVDGCSDYLSLTCSVSSSPVVNMALKYGEKLERTHL